MTTDVPQHTLKKNIFKEKPREVKILVNTDDKGQLRNKSSKFCGLIPRGFCYSNRLRGICMKTHPSVPSTASVSSISGSENE
nr:hypothetical protein [Tanacetum cinerariifolium]